MIHENHGYLSRRLHDSGVDRSVVDQPTEARGVLFFGAMRELLLECSECLTGKIPHAIWNFVCRVDNGCHEALAPPLQQLEVCITISWLVPGGYMSPKDGRTADILCASIRIVQCLVER